MSFLYLPRKQRGRLTAGAAPGLYCRGDAYRGLFRTELIAPGFADGNSSGGETALIIRSLSLKTPSLRVTNDDVLAAIAKANPDVPARTVDKYCRTLEHLLKRAGAQTRFYRDRTKGETALGLIIDAATRAIEDSGAAPSDIDAIIFCGVARGFLEPASAAFVSGALGLTCDAFDVSEACMSWVRALHIAYNFLTAGTYSTVLIVNGEFTVFEHGLPDICVIKSLEQLRYTFAAFTIGEAASATVVSASPHPWHFRFRSDPSLVDLCTLPIKGYEDFARPSRRLGLNGPHQLVAFSHELFSAAADQMTRFVRETYADPKRFAIWFPHAASASLCDAVARRLELGERVYSRAFAAYGNLVSASIPAGMAMALEEGRLRRGDHVVLCPASAGLSLALVDGQY
jgi:acyl-CoA:acyl-CoA alkyltransferase